MTVPGWNAQQYHEKMQRRHAAPEPRSPARPGRTKKIAGLALAAVVFGAITVAATHDDGTERIGICHATGSETQPYVWIVADKDGYEHGHHRHHEGDYFRSADAGGCSDDEPVDHAENGTDNATAEGNGTAAGNATDDAGDDNATADDGAAPADNGTADGGDNSTAPEDNSTAADNGTEAAPGDAWVSQEAWQDQHEVVLTIVVGNAGEGDATDVTLSDELPDLRRSWHLDGEDADQCVLSGQDLSCWFGSLAPGETRQIELQAFTDRMPCGFSQTNTAQIAATDDPESRNDASSASIQARGC